MVDALVLLDNNNRVRYCSDTAETVLGLFPEQAVGQPVAEVLLRRLAGTGHSELVDPLLKMIDSHTGSTESIEVTCSQQQTREYVVTVFPPSTTMEDVKTGVLVRDVTKEREAERRRDTFIAVLAHELRDPITAVMGFTRMLLEKSSLTETEREWLENVHICGRRLNAMTADLLDVVGIRAGSMAISLEPVSLTETLNEVLPVIEEAYAGPRCSIHISRDLPCVIADRTRIAQVLSNLLSNATKYGPKDGQIKVFAHHDPHRGKVVVAVSDEGSGISLEEMEYIFTPFQRAHRMQKQGINGVGLGLYIVKGLVELMHGKLWVESEVGKGSTFYFSLPTQPSPYLYSSPVLDC